MTLKVWENKSPFLFICFISYLLFSSDLVQGQEKSVPEIVGIAYFTSSDLKNAVFNEQNVSIPLDCTRDFDSYQDTRRGYTVLLKKENYQKKVINSIDFSIDLATFSKFTWGAFSNIRFPLGVDFELHIYGHYQGRADRVYLQGTWNPSLTVSGTSRLQDYENPYTLIASFSTFSFRLDNANDNVLAFKRDAPVSVSFFENIPFSSYGYTIPSVLSPYDSTLICNGEKYVHLKTLRVSGVVYNNSSIGTVRFVNKFEVSKKANCGDVRDKLVDEYRKPPGVKDITTGNLFVPNCEDFTKTAKSSKFEFNRLVTHDKLEDPNWPIPPDPNLWGLIRHPLTVPDPVVGPPFGLDSWVNVFNRTTNNGYGARIITSGYRTPVHNSKTPSGVQSSRHLFGDAIDLRNNACFECKFDVCGPPKDCKENCFRCPANPCTKDTPEACENKKIPQNVRQEWAEMNKAALWAGASYFEPLSATKSYNHSHADWRKWSGSYEQ